MLTFLATFHNYAILLAFLPLPLPLATLTPSLQLALPTFAPKGSLLTSWLEICYGGGKFYRLYPRRLAQCPLAPRIRPSNATLSAVSFERSMLSTLTPARKDGV